MNGAMDDVWLPGNPDTSRCMNVGDGTPRLAVVKGAGIVADVMPAARSSDWREDSSL